MQTVLYCAIIISCWNAENILLRLDVRRKKQRAGVNALFAISAFPIQIVMAMACTASALWVTQHHWGLLYSIPGYDSGWVRFGLMFVVLDFLDYVYHVAMHHIPLFWRFHLVHHTDQEVDSSTTAREHPGETLIRNLFLLAWVWLCGASLEILVLRQTVESACNILSHTSLRVSAHPSRVLGWLLITPHLHRVHHHFRLPYTNKNYGDVFSVWDRLFGTFATLAPADTVFGLDTHMSVHGDTAFARAMAMPFDSGDGRTGRIDAEPVLAAAACFVDRRGARPC